MGKINNMGREFANYKSVEKWLKERTDKDFFIMNDKGNTIWVVICRDNKLIKRSFGGSYMQWFTTRHAEAVLEFINQ